VTGSDLNRHQGLGGKLDGLALEYKVTSYFIVGCATRQHDHVAGQLSCLQLLQVCERIQFDPVSTQ
jgi:hypothetical protein